MYCKVCGLEVDDNSKYCAHCGANLTEEFEEKEEVVAEVVGGETKKPAKCWSIFAKLGSGLGLGGLISSCIPFVCMVGVEIAMLGLVFSILGKKHSNSKKGIILSSVGLGVGFLMCFITGIILGLIEYFWYY